MLTVSLTAASGEPVIAIVPQTERGYHPLWAACTRAVAAPMERRLSAGLEGLEALHNHEL